MSTTYHLGGYKPDMPNGNMAERRDPVSGTITRWNDKGAVIDTKLMPPAEIVAALEIIEPAPDPLAALLDALATAKTVEEINAAAAALIDGKR